jgi:hypothetical protein
MPTVLRRKPARIRSARRKAAGVARGPRGKRKFFLSDAEIARINGAQESLTAAS